MDTRRFNGHISASSSSDSSTAARCLQPNYDSHAVQEALEHLASMDLDDLCNEAKVERCRATRDLRSCGRYVQYVLNSCGHASLCKECSQRIELCPICKIHIPKNGTRFRPRLYCECIEAGLISKRYDERFQEKEDDELVTADVERLYSLFDVAMENNLVCLICNYVTDVCMDETAVSSDPVISFLLDEVVVKDWCKRTFKNIITELQVIYKLGTEEMKSRLSLLLKFSTRLVGISNVLEVLESSFKGTVSGQLHDLHQLQESILRTKQHTEIMMWCIRHQFLENVESRYTNFKSWCSCIRERKSASIKRSWPNSLNHSAEIAGQDGSLFIEDALGNLEIEQESVQDMGEIASLQKDGIFSFFRSKIEGVAGCYPFENLRSAVDILFLHGNSDLVLAKQGIFLYYLFDRHYTLPDEIWRHIVDDFAATFSITRQSVLESFSFYLLDDHTDKALQEACHLLPEISGPETHPKIAQVLLERKNPDNALMVLRWSGRDGGSQLVSLSEAVTAVRVRMQCGLLTEAFTYQRMLCTRFREKKLKFGPSRNVSDHLKDESGTWVEALVTEICFLCILGNLVDRMIELPWNSDEEKYLHKCLLDYAIDDPSTTTGNLLVVFYIQRYRYGEAYQVHLKLQAVEENFISQNSVSEEVLTRMRSASHWRAGLVDKSIDLLPEVQQLQVKSGKFPENALMSGEVEMSAKDDLHELQDEGRSTSLLLPSSINSVPVRAERTSFTRQLPFETPTKFGGSVHISGFERGNYGSPSILHERLFTNAERGPKSQVGINSSFKFDDISTPGSRLDSHLKPTPFKEINRNSSRVLLGSYLHDNQSDRQSTDIEQNGLTSQLQNPSPPYSRRVTANPVSTPNSHLGFSNDSGKDLPTKFSSKRVQSDRGDRPWDMTASDDPMEISLNNRENGFAVENPTSNGGLRWRSDETSDEEEQSPVRGIGAAASYTNPRRGIRKGRLSRR